MSRSNAKRLLFTVGSLEGDEGIASQLNTLTERLQARGWTIGLAGHFQETDAETTPLTKLRNRTDATFPIRFPDALLSVSGMVDALQTLADLRQAVASFQPRIVHTHSLSLSPLLYLLRRWYETPTLATCHIEFAHDRRDIDLASIFTRVIPGLLGDRVIAISDRMASLFATELGIPADRIETIPNGVDPDHFRPPSREEKQQARESFGLDFDEPVVCLVGRLDPVKGHKVLFRALQHLDADNRSVRAICAGTGGFEDRIERRATEYGVRDQVLFPGFVDARTVYWASDVNVLPSYREGFGLVVPEGMLCGVPAIRTPTAGARDQIDHGETGFIVPFDAPRELAGRIRYLLDRPDERHSMGRAGAARAGDRFALQRSIDRTEKLYRTLATN